MIEGLERINIELTHTYGLTEVYGPSAACTITCRCQSTRLT